MPITVLPPYVVSKIAAGEVVERPASVVKELVENSLDSGATQITIEVSGGGRQLIRVSDNGSGIPESEVELAFERHATSKITSEKDIETISSLGFRGEALPTIASVAEVSMVTKYQDGMAGTAIKLESGVITNKVKQGCPQGTTIAVRNLFENVPARLKFLKSISTENSHISYLVSQYSLAFPGVRFNLMMNGRTSLRSPGTGILRDALLEVYGLKIAQAMLEITSSDDRISGFISPSSVSRSNRNYLSFFVNRRWVQSRMMTYAVEEAYHGMLMTGKHPIVVLNISLPPQDIDVNVHPTKREIKFRQEREVFTMVQKAVRETLVGFSPVPSMRVSSPLSHSATSPFLFSSGSTPSSLSRAGDLKSAAPEPDTELRQPELTSRLPILRVIGQFHNSYIVAEAPDGLYLIDQHAAHERIVFEKIRKQQVSQAVDVQGLLEPLTIEVTARQDELLKSQQQILTEAGFQLDPFGERVYLLRSVPAVLKRQEVAGVLTEIIDSLGESQRIEWQDRIAASLACHGAVRAGQTMSHQEMVELVRQMEETVSPRTCPHGRPTMIHLSTSQLASAFGRR